ncbi:MAG: serine hydrolase domain-containing protein [Alphaproteobacteria bacterium]
MDQLKRACDAVLARATAGAARVPGVVAMVTGRDGTLYSGAAGVRRLGGPAMTEDTVLAYYSVTKAIGGTAVLQCVEDGLLDLDAPTKTYVPEIARLQVLTGFAADGTPQTRPPRRDITTRQLLLHTAGLGYDSFNPIYRRLVAERGQLSVTTGRMAALQVPLLFDPGERWEYGANIDWACLAVERIRGRRLGDVLRERVFAPLGMADIAFTRTAAMKARTATIHRRGADGALEPDDAFGLPDDPEVDMAGHGLYGTVPAYIRFIRMWLNDGAGPHGRVLQPETVAMAVTDGLTPPQRVAALPAANPEVTNVAEFFPGQRKSWGYTFMINDEDAPTGRPAGSVGWAGLANCYYWIDRRNGVGGFWGSQLLPFADTVALPAYLDFETAVYDWLASR